MMTRIVAVVSPLILVAMAGAVGMGGRSDGGESPGATHTPAAPPGRDSTMVIVDASDFFHVIQKNHVIVDADALRVPWLFNNTGLEMRTNSNYVVRATVPASGTYYLYARTHGPANSSLRIAINDRIAPVEVADGPLEFERIGEFELDAGEIDIRLMRIVGRPVFDVLVLSKNPDLREEELIPHQLDPDVVLLREYRIPQSSAVKFGDMTGDGRIDMLVFTRNYSAHAFDNDGNPLWSWEAPEEGSNLRAEFEAPGLVWDLDGDGAAEAIHWRQEEGAEWLVAADGRTGEVVHRAPWPTRPLPHVYNNFRLAIGRLAPGGRPNHVVVFTDMGGEISIAAYDAELNQLWNHVEPRLKDHLGHYVYPVDVDGDGVDEVLVSALLLDAQGDVIWNRFDFFYDHHDHADSYRFADLNGDGRRELVAAHSETGVFAFDALTGAILWQNMAEHSQQLETGYFLAGQPGPQVAIGARTYGNRDADEPYLSAQVHWFSPTGELITRWPGMPLNGNPVFVKGDWRGDGTEELFWYRFRLTEDGTGELYFADQVFHMFDFDGDGAEEVITLANGRLRVYGSASALRDPENARRDPDYMKERVANHTHY
ncbi:MAG TPA: hypothetical protein VNZ57_14330 [Longimicrobiales bacterium]|nr:hypothetical protein [Longimicrobiales bacterium]